MGHPGKDRTFSLMLSRFYWPKMYSDVQDYVSSCGRCIRFKTPPQREELKPILAKAPWELIHVDFLSLEVPVTGPNQVAMPKDVLIVTDHFTRFARAFVTPNQKARTVAEVLWNQFFMVYGIPQSILSDRGQNFESNLFKNLLKVAGIKKLRTTPYRPQTNGACERFNRTLISLIGTMELEDKKNWIEKLNTLTHLYNCTRSSMTGHSPYKLVFGREPILPVDLEFGLPGVTGIGGGASAYANKLKETMQRVHELAEQQMVKRQRQMKKYYDKKANSIVLQEGDLVLVRNEFRGRKKLLDRWSPDVYEIKKQVDKAFPVYRVENTKGDTQTLHRNRLLPVLLAEEDESPPEQLQLSAAAVAVNGCPYEARCCSREEASFWMEDNLEETPEKGKAVAVANRLMEQYFS